MGFKGKFEKNLNQELEEEHPDPPPPVDVEYQHHPQPANIFPSYPCAPPPQRSGIHIPTPIFALFVLIFLFESSVLFVYTAIGLFNTLPAGFVPVSVNKQGAAGCDCAVAGLDRLPINVAPNIYMASPASDNSDGTLFSETHEVTVTVTASSQSQSTKATTSTPSTLSTVVSSTSVLESDSVAISNILGALTQSSTAGIVTVTPPIPTITVLSTASASQSVLTMTVLSTTTPQRSTVTSIDVVTGPSPTESTSVSAPPSSSSSATNNPSTSNTSANVASKSTVSSSSTPLTLLSSITSSSSPLPTTADSTSNTRTTMSTSTTSRRCAPGGEGGAGLEDPGTFCT